MKLIVSNIKSKSVDYDSKEFDKCLKYVSSITDNKQLLPKKSQEIISFEVRNTNCDFMNCIRRVAYDEVPIYSMHIETKDIETDDKYIISDGVVKKNIEMIPFLQDITDDKISKLKLSINVENKSMDYITIYTRDIQIMLNDKKENTENYISGNIPLFSLRSDKFIKVNNITIIKGIGKNDYSKFIFLSNITYKILDVVPFDEDKLTRVGESSLNSTPTHFYMSFKTHRNIAIKHVIPKICNVISDKFTKILNELKNIKSSDSVYFSDLIEIETKDEFKKFHFKGEYWTLINVLSKYCYNELPTIPYIASSIIHPSIEEGILTINYSDPIKLLNNAISTFLKDLEIFEKAF
jgi:DNA-directed RNA polymerase subunit L